MNATTIEAISGLIVAVSALLAALGIGKHSKNTRQMLDTHKKEVGSK